LVTALTEYIWLVDPTQSVAFPVIELGVEGAAFPTETANVEVDEVPHAFSAVTVISPFEPDVPAVTVILFVP
jgi:hypothetical protein